MTGRYLKVRISFLEAVYGFRVSFLSLYFFLGYEFNFMTVSGAVCAFTKRIALKTSVKSVTIAFIVKYIVKLNKT